MKLYSVPHSPYSSRIRIQIYNANLPIEICEPIGGIGSDTFKALTPTGKVPTLEVDGTCLPESMAIMEWVEERFPESGLTPESLNERAWVRAVSRVADLYLTQALFPLFMELKLKSGDQQAIQKNLAALKKELQTLESFMTVDYRPNPASLNLADCALAPSLFYVVSLAPLFGENDILGGVPALKSWWQQVNEQPAVARVIGEMAAGLKVMMSA